MRADLTTSVDRLRLLWAFLGLADESLLFIDLLKHMLRCKSFGKSSKNIVRIRTSIKSSHPDNVFKSSHVTLFPSNEMQGRSLPLDQVANYIASVKRHGEQ